MSLTALDIARAAVAAAAEHMEQSGLHADLRNLDRLLLQAAHERSGTVQLTITTPAGDIGAFAETIAKAVEAKTGRKVDVRQKADPTLLGGAIVQFGDELIDFSLRGGLDHAKQQLNAHA